MMVEIDTKKEAISQLQTQRSSNMSQYKQMESKLFDLKYKVDLCHDEYEEAMSADNDKVSSE